MFLPGPDGTVIAEFSPDEVELIATLAMQVTQLIGDREPQSHDPAIVRLLPSAYPDDPDAAAEFRRFTERDLAARKVDNAELVIASLGDGVAVVLGHESVQAWLRSLTDIRLIIATRLGITADDDPGNVSSTDGAMMRDVYDWLGYLQESLVRTLP